MATKASKTTSTGHAAGIFADMTLDGPEIGTLVAVVDRAKNLPNRKTMGKQDPYCAMRLGKEARKTDTDRRGGQTPKWDQELRFIVHDSPDYYKLKVSIFNDDKKTDLIGEAWISLHDLIKPGGGSNDLWHNLNYKGKYAGDIRMELTYYDKRPREEKPAEKRKQREKTPSTTPDLPVIASAARQLGPREVRRRPLPVNPATQTPPPSSSSSSSQQQQQQQQQHEAPTPPPKIPLDHIEQHTVHVPPPPQQMEDDDPYAFDAYAEDIRSVEPTQQYHSFGYHMEQSLPEQTYQPNQPPRHDDFSPYPDEVYHEDRDESPLPQHQLQHYQPQVQPYQPEDDYDNYDSGHQQDHYQDETYQSPVQTFAHSTQAQSTPSYRNDREIDDRRRSQHRVEQQNPPHSSPQSLPRSSPTGMEMLPYRPQASNGSPLKSSQHRDHPLRQSMSQQGYSEFFNEPESYNTPPPPPRHRDTTPRKLQPDYPPSSYNPQQARDSSRRSSIDERSPLQNLERNFDPYNQDLYATSQSGMPQYRAEPHNSYDMHQRPDSIPQQSQQYERRKSRNDSTHEASDQRPIYRRDLTGSFEDRSPGADYRNEAYDSNAHARSQPDLPSHVHQSTPPLRPRPMKPTPNHTPTRKSVSPNPFPTQDGRGMSSVPFNPDAYDVLNPASSPVTNEYTPFQTPEQAKEAQRFREVEKLRDQGPIIGNDGRVIDPSDHLPSDTWAPEPEKKTRRPEHVIHVRTKNERSQGQSPSTGATRPNGRRPAPTQNSPMNSSSSVPLSAGRSRAQPSVAPRPLPNQPYPQPHRNSTSNVEPRQQQSYQSPSARSPNQQAHHRNSYIEPPAAPPQQIRRNSYQESQLVHRPAPSEYQVPFNTYNSRNSYQQYPSPPPKQIEYIPPSVSSGSSYDDPLAAEMSMIDIGPSRGGRTALRSSQGYGM